MRTKRTIEYSKQAGDSAGTVQVHLLACIHGRTKAQDGELATLLVFRFTMLNKLDQFINTASIRLGFDTIPKNSHSNLDISQFTPSRKTRFTPHSNAASIDKPISEKDLGSIDGKLVWDSDNRPRRLQLNIASSEISKRGVPRWFNVAILLRRDTNDQFQASLDIKIETQRRGPGRPARLVSGPMVNEPIIFDPVVKSFGGDDLKIDAQNVADYPFQRVEYGDIETESELPEVQNASFVELWSFERNGSVVRPKASDYLSMKKDRSKFLGVPSAPLKSTTKEDLLDTYFTHFKKTEAGHVTEDDESDKTTMNNIYRLSLFVFETTNNHIDFFGDDGLRLVGKFFNLPKGYGDPLLTDEGVCSNEFLDKGNHVFIVRTPRSGNDRWSLILICDPDFTNGAAIFRLDARADATEADVAKTKIPTALKALYEEEIENMHPLLLLRELFSSYHNVTTKRFDKVLDRVEKVDSAIMDMLRYESNSQPQQSRSPETAAKTWWQRLKSMANSAPKKARGMDSRAYDFSSHSKSLHEARMELVELAKRSKFESQVSEKLQTNLSDNQYLASRFSSVIESASRHGRDISELPDRITGQTNILYSLIAQRDARLQYTLAKETVKDSKAMKTLAIITIVFLPGTFVAAIFSTDLAPSKERQGPIFAAVVVPVTVVLIVAWIVWIKTNPYGSSFADIELGGGSGSDETWKAGKQS
ncbi:hypothetical protein F5Y10DRAFT_244732 [Nemania abortiva]|nr:hypothetical protein F5Y10DRAFT_244732 [Nemania abortiva]